MSKSLTIVVALGGNAIKKPAEKGTEDEMIKNVHTACEQLALLAKAGHKLVITHGNGPQVGAIVLQNENSAPTIPAMDLCVCGAETQGMLGYFLQQNLGNIMRETEGLSVVSLVTQTMVDLADPAFQHPTKPIGKFYTAAEAEDLRKKGNTVVEDAGRGYRVVVPSPRPTGIVEEKAIRALVDAGHLVVASGGGGIPVVRAKDGTLHGVAAVIDKDLAGSTLASMVNADVYMIVTDVEYVFSNYGKPDATACREMTVAEARQRVNNKEFPAGSMGPKVLAALEFVERSGKKAIITSLDKAFDALAGKTGTRVVPTPTAPYGGIFENITWPTGAPLGALDAKVSELALKYTPLACTILKEAIRIPADHRDHKGGIVGMSNHEGPRLEYLKKMCVEHKCVARPEDVWFDDFGSIVWTVEDPDDAVPRSAKKVIFFDGHTDTVNPLPEEWRRKTGGIDVYDGLFDASKVNVEFLRSELGYLPDQSEWKHLIFGRGGADQLSGVVSQMIGTKIALELKGMGALRGVVIKSYGTVAEEDNDGGAPMFVMRKQLLNGPAENLPDVVVHTEGTGDRDKSACGIYIGQRGRMQIEVEVTGRSCHGSMPWMGLNPLEYAADIISEARRQYLNGETFLSDPFLEGGTRTASWCDIQTPSDCAVPAVFTFRFDRRITVGETPAMALKAVEDLSSVAAARKAGLTVDVRVPKYNTPTWKGYTPDNEQIYMGWMTPPTHPAVHAAVEAYKRVVTPALPADHKETKTSVPREPRVDRWIFSTDGVGYPIPKDSWGASLVVPESKRWVDAGAVRHPAQIGMGIGFEQNTHKIGEFIDERHFPAALAFMARFPSMYAERTGAQGAWKQ